MRTMELADLHTPTAAADVPPAIAQTRRTPVMRPATADERKVDDASLDSFPASDPPSLTCVTGIRLR